MKSDTTNQTRTGIIPNRFISGAPLSPALDLTCVATTTDFADHLPQTVAPPTKLLLTVRDCSAMTSLSEKTILRLLKRGKIRCISAIRHKRIPASELSRFIRENLI